MKILFSADHHIKVGQKNVPREWQINRYKMLFSKLHDLEQRCDVHIMGGDVFDTIPKPVELGLYFDFISECSIPTLIYDGNHEATKKGSTFMEFLISASEKLNSKVHIISGIEEHYGIDFIPYTHLKTFNPKDFTNNILCTHVRGEIPPHVLPEIDLDLFNRWDVVLAGDLHSYGNSQRNILYPGSPLSITFHRTMIENGVIIFDTDTMTHEFINLELPQLIRKTVDSEDEIVKTDYHHTIYEVTGNVVELSNIKSNLIDKKIINTKDEATLSLTDLSVQEELSLYLEEILKLSKKDIKDTLRIFSDFYKELEME